MADLTVYQPAGWNNKIPIGTNQLSGTNTHSYTGNFYDNQILYFNFASANLGAVAASNYTIRAEVTGTGGSNWTWTVNSTDPSNFAYLTTDMPIGPLASGSHTFKVWLDYNNNVIETSETNNYYERTITVLSSAPVEYYAECDDNLFFGSPISSGWITQTQYTFTSLTPGQTYWYRVKGRQGSAESAWSNVESSQQESGALITVSPGAYDFGLVETGGTGQGTFVVQNIGTGTLSGSASVAAPFSVISGSPYNLAANEFTNVTVRFSPTNSGAAVGTVTFTGGGGTSRSLFATAFTRVGVTNAPGSLTLRWGAGTLYSADSITGPWTPVVGAVPPFVITPAVDKKFYRVEE